MTISISIKQRFQVNLSGDYMMFSICETCGAAVLCRRISTAGFTTTDCRRIHHEWHKKLEQAAVDAPVHNWDLGGR